MAKIISIGTALPPYRHRQEDILQFLEKAYDVSDQEKRILRFLSRQSAIDTRYSVVPDYGRPAEEREFYPPTQDMEPFPSLERRMEWFEREAWKLSVQGITACLEGASMPAAELTHLITVSCTGLSAPGLELKIVEEMQLPPNLHRSAVNFMGCYAAVHGLKQADAIVKAYPGSKVMVVCTELCTLHFQKAYSQDAAAASLLFGDGCAAVLVTDDAHPARGVRMDSFYAEVLFSGKKDMAWRLSSTGFLMTLSGYVPELIQQDLGPLKDKALQHAGLRHEDIAYWCMHPGGKRILQAIGKCLELSAGDLAWSYKVLREQGNMSSATILFVLGELWAELMANPGKRVFGAAFGPGLTMESMVMTAV